MGHHHHHSHGKKSIGGRLTAMLSRKIQEESDPKE